MDKPYRVIQPQPDASAEEIAEILNAQHDMGYDLVTCHVAAYREGDLGEVSSSLIFRLRADIYAKVAPALVGVSAEEQTP